MRLPTARYRREFEQRFTDPDMAEYYVSDLPAIAQPFIYSSSGLQLLPAIAPKPRSN
jgi:hypothetical protein